MNKIISTLLCFIVLINFSPAYAAANLWSLTSDSQVSFAAEMKVNSEVQQLKNRADVISLNKPVLNNLAVGDNVLLPIDNNFYEVTFTRFQKNKNESITWYGELVDYKAKSPVILTIGANNFFIRVVTPYETYTVSGRGLEGRLLSESELNNVIDTKKEDFLFPHETEEFLKQESIKKQIELQRQKHNEAESSHFSLKAPVSHSSLALVQEPATSDSSTVNIDILILYTPDVDTLYGGDPLTRIYHLIAVTNQIYFDSGVYIQLNAVAIDLVNYTDNVFSDVALNDLTFQENEAFAHIPQRRFELGADMVVLFRPYISGDSSCGIAWIGGQQGSVAGYKNYMYSHTSIDCSDYVMAHELGHNMGLAHSRKQNNVGATFPFALGHGVDNEFTTVMGYPGVFNAGTVYKFSSPDLDCNGLPCGVDKNNEESGADAVFALNAVRTEIEHFYDSTRDLTLFDDALSQVSDVNLKQCIINRNDGFTYAGELKSLFCGAEGVSSIEGLNAFSGIEQLALYSNNIVDISGLEGLVNLKSLDISSNSISDLSGLTSLVNLNELYASENDISDINQISALTSLRELDLRDNQVDDIASLASLSSLHTFRASSNNITDVSALTNLVSLNILDLSYNAVQNIESLEGLVSLYELHLNHNQISTIPFTMNMPNLTSLYINDNDIDDITALSALTSLVYLNIGSNNISDISVISAAEGLKYFWAYSNNITTISALETLTSLFIISLEYNNVSDIAPVFNLKDNLEYLYVYNNNSIACWQVDYALVFFAVWEPASCDLGTESADYDNDGITNAKEVELALDPFNPDDAILDSDNDGLTNLEEVLLGTNIYESDTDGDGLSDSEEVNLGSDPLDPLSKTAPTAVVLSFSDTNNDDISDLLKYSFINGNTQFSIIDGRDFTTLTTFELSDEFDSTSIELVGDRNNDGIKEIGLFGFNSAVGRYQLAVYNGYTGQGMGTWNWANTLGEVAFQLVEDLTNDGVEEYAITGIHLTNGTKQLFVKNGATKQTYKTFKWPNQWVDAQIVIMSDITNDAVPEVALYGRHERLDKGQLFVFDGANSNTKLDVYNWNKLWNNISLYKMDDIDGDGTIDWGQFGQRKDDGRYQWVVKKGHDKRGVIRTFSWPNDLTDAQPLLLSDRTGDDVKEVALYGKNSSGKLLLRVNDGRLANTRIANYSWPAIWTNEQVMELGDLNNDGTQEVALLGINVNSGKYQLVIKDGQALSEYGRLTLEGDWADLAISSYDVNSDGQADVIVNGVDASTLTRIITVFGGNDLGLLSTTVH